MTSDADILETAARRRDERMAWWREARFGVFVHWGLYAQLGRGEWVMNRDCIPVSAYEPLADTWQPEPDWAPRLAAAAHAAGARYVVLTAKHHEGFCLWNTKTTDYHAVARGPGRDLVREFLDACRAAGLRTGLYYSLMDWHHPDGARCAHDDAARRRFLDFTQAGLRELMTGYGPIDLLFFDVAWPLETAAAWESEAMCAMVRRAQPDILINNRARLLGDFETPEGEVKAVRGRDWEACTTLNDGEWGYSERVPGDWHSVRDVLRMLRTCAAEGGNLLLNVGPRPDGGLDARTTATLSELGAWTSVNGEALYGAMTPTAGRLEPWASHGYWTLCGTRAYLWNLRTEPRDGTLIVGGLQTPVQRVTVLGHAAPLSVEQRGLQTIVRGLPPASDSPAGTPVLCFEFAQEPRQAIGMGCQVEGPRWCLGSDAAGVAAEAAAAG